jgi:hypothetical protein
MTRDGIDAARKTNWRRRWSGGLRMAKASIRKPPAW